MDCAIYPTVRCLFEDYLVIFAHSGGDHQGICVDAGKISILQQYALPYLKGKRMPDICKEDIENIKRHLRREGIIAPKIERLHTALSQLFELAWIQGIVRGNPCEGVYRCSISKKRPVLYTQTQYGQIFSALEMLPYSGVFQTMAMTGIPLEGCIGLTYDRIEWEKHRMIIGQWMSFSETGQAKLIYGNRNCAEYEVLIPDRLETILRMEIQMQERCREMRYGRWFNPDGLIFTDGHGNPVQPKDIRKQYDAIRKLSGVEGVCMRTMRSSYLLNTLMECKHLPEAARQAGFANVQTVIPYYEEAMKIKRAREREAI